jgi:protein-S-isoprenylcysteine O-methyltransferase Ste14
MNLSTDTTETNLKTQRENIRIRIRKDLVGTLFVSAALLAGAGRLDWSIAWIYIALNFLGLVVNWVVLAAKNPQIFAARADITKEDTKSWDKTFTALYGPMLLLIMAVTGIDAGRYGWSLVPGWLQWLGIGLFIFGWSFSLWALVSNPHFETSVRIQEDRGHSTFTGGPYAIVRHPGYVGVALLYAVSPLFLGSWWGLIPAALLTAAFIYRTPSSTSCPATGNTPKRCATACCPGSGNPALL